MKKTYTKKQITEAIKYWEKRLHILNEAIDQEIYYRILLDFNDSKFNKACIAFDTYHPSKNDDGKFWILPNGKIFDVTDGYHTEIEYYLRCSKELIQRKYGFNDEYRDDQIGSDTPDVYEVIRCGCIRVASYNEDTDDGGVAIHIGIRPTASQYDVLYDIADRLRYVENSNFIVDFGVKNMDVKAASFNVDASKTFESGEDFYHRGINVIKAYYQ